MSNERLVVNYAAKQTQNISLGNNLRKLRNGANLTQEQVIAQLQLHNFSIFRSAYSRIEAGSTITIS